MSYCLSISHWRTSSVPSEPGREKIESRIYIAHLLQAEEDRDQVRRYYADQAREKELFGSNTSPHNSDRYALMLFVVAVGELSSSRLADLWLHTRFVRPTVSYSPSKE